MGQRFEREVGRLGNEAFGKRKRAVTLDLQEHQWEDEEGGTLELRMLAMVGFPGAISRPRKITLRTHRNGKHESVDRKSACQPTY